MIWRASVFSWWFLLDKLCYHLVSCSCLHADQMTPRGKLFVETLLEVQLRLLKPFLWKFFSQSWSGIGKFFRRSQNSGLGHPLHQAETSGRREKQMLFGAGSFKTPLDWTREDWDQRVLCPLLCSTLVLHKGIFHISPSMFLKDSTCLL